LQRQAAKRNTLKKVCVSQLAAAGLW